MAGKQREKKKPVSIYFAAPLFTQAERLWNKGLATALRMKRYQVILPQERAEPMLQGNEPFMPQVLFDHSVSSIDRSDIVVAVLDGADPDSGTCWECGYAWGRSIPIIGIRTDLRSGGDDPDNQVNLMLAKSCKSVIPVAKAEKTVRRIANLVDVAVRSIFSDRTI